MNKGQAITGLIVTAAAAIAITYGFIYTSLYTPLENNQYQDHGDIQTLKAQISDIPIIKQEVEALLFRDGIDPQRLTQIIK